MIKRVAIPCLALFVLACTARAAAEEAYRYPSVPKGVVVEGVARGVEPIQTIDYDARRNAFVLNGGAATYQNPLSKEEFKELLGALADHNHIGTSIRQDKTFFTYGTLPTSAKVARDLAAADRVLGGVVFAIRNFIGNRRLPGNYTPKFVDPQRRRILSAATFKFKDYVFSKDGNRAYQRADFTFDTELIPVKMDQRAPDGGYTADPEAMRRNDVEPADRENFNHLRSYQNDYLAMPEVAKVVQIGEAAAFIRWVRGGQTGPRGVIYGGRTDLLAGLEQKMR